MLLIIVMLNMDLDVRKPSSGVCEQQRCRPAWASTQSDQGLCYSLIGKYHIKTCYKRNFTILASLCSWGDWFESRFVRHLINRFCRVKAHMFMYYIPPNFYAVNIQHSRCKHVFSTRVEKQCGFLRSHLIWIYTVFYRGYILIQQDKG